MLPLNCFICQEKTFILIIRSAFRKSQLGKCATYEKQRIGLCNDGQLIFRHVLCYNNFFTQ